MEHLAEMRARAVWCALVLGAGFGVGWYFQDTLFAILNRPLGGEYRVQTLAVTEPFFTTLTVAAHLALMVCLPAVLYHGYRFASPALQPAQRRGVRGLLCAAPFLFYAGVAFCYFLVLGPAVRFLLGMGEGSFDVAVRAREYYSFVASTLLATGAVFLSPLVLLGLARVGLLTTAQLRANRRVALAGVAIVAALLPTADIVSLVVEIVALTALFELSVLLVAFQERLARRREAAEAPQ